MMNHLTELQIWSYLELDLTDAELEWIEQHLEHCDLCAERLAVMASLSEQVPNLLPLEAPSAGFADRVMETIATEAVSNVIPLKPHKKSSRLEFFTRFATAAVVTGFMLLGSAHASGIPVIGSVGKAMSVTGNVVTDSTFQLYAKIDVWIATINEAITN